MNLIPSSIMPVLFVGHGNPMNAIEANEFTQAWENLSVQIPLPQAIVCISAHWETQGTFVTAMAQPKTIHDFGGFPKALFDVQYPAPGFPELASDIQKKTMLNNINLDFESWGLDHGAWSVIKNLYPSAQIPVIQISIDYYKKPEQHYELAKELSFLRSMGVLIIASGNVVHNLKLANWSNLNAAFDWAQESNTYIKNAILERNHAFLINYKNQGSAFQLAIPTSEHYIPLLYALGLQTYKDEVSFFTDKIIMGSLSMTGVLIQHIE